MTIEKPKNYVGALFRHMKKHMDIFPKWIQNYSDKLSKFVFKYEKSKGVVFDRLSRIYNYIFIDEVQDLAGYDLELIKAFISK